MSSAGDRPAPSGNDPASGKDAAHGDAAVPEVDGASTEESPSVADRRMADLLARGNLPSSTLRRQIEGIDAEQSDDLLARLGALDFLDSVVGEDTGELPEKLGDYRITGLLGRGGMGTVFEAFEESLERSVALKVLSPSMSSDQNMRRRFRVEARANATLHHQHIVPVYGFGESNGLLYFSMERVDGVSLDRLIRRGPSADLKPIAEPRELARCFAGVADALSHAHRRDVLHRDVKPGNILVHPDGAFALADFGLSKMLGEHSMSMSRQGGFLGTLHYAAPEQAKGHPATPASDLYALGVTMFETLTRRLPLDGDSTEAMLQAVLYQRPKALRECLPKVSRDLDAVVGKLLEKDAADRYQDGAELSRDLLRIADDEPVRIRRQSVIRRVWRLMRKHPGLSAALFGILVLTSVSLILWRQNVIGERSGQVTRHQNLLTLAMSTVDAEPGPPGGPASELTALVGVRFPVKADSAVLGFLDDAGTEFAADRHTEELRAGYIDDPAPQATALLLAGRGYQAREVFSAAIEAADQSAVAAASDAEAWLREYRLDRLRLYRLYIGRALACLTGSVGDADAAAKDLLRAEFVRPGAFLPKVLSAVLDWDPAGASGSGSLLQKLDALRLNGPPGADAAVGRVLLALVGVRRPVESHLMRFALRAELRTALYAAASDLVSDLPTGATSPWCGSLEAELSELAKEALAVVGNPPEQERILRPGWSLLDSFVDPRAPLQAWRLVFAAVDGDVGVVSSRDGVALSSELALQGWLAFLELAPSTAIVQSVESAVRATLTDVRTAASTPERLVRRVEALLAATVGTPMAALEAADEYVRADSADAEAYVLRFWSRLRLGETAWAWTDASNAIDRALDPDAVRAKLLELLDRETTSRNAAEWAGLREAFAGPK